MRTFFVHSEFLDFSDITADMIDRHTTITNMKCLFLSNLILLQALFTVFNSQVHLVTPSTLSRIAMSYIYFFKYCYFQNTWARVEPYQQQLLRPHPPRTLQPPCPTHCSLPSQTLHSLTVVGPLHAALTASAFSLSSAACKFLSSLSLTLRYQIQFIIVQKLPVIKS